MRCGIEFEYMVIDTRGPEAGRVRDFGNLDYRELTRMLGEKPGRDDPRLFTGDLGIRSGYWYLEGDERFDEQGRFRTFVVKGIEVRTPPAESVSAAVDELLALERALSERLSPHGLGLAIASYNPMREGYVHDPPLNAWERRLRRVEPSYDGSLVSTLTYGPDVNLSMPEWDEARSLDIARKLHAYSPYIVPFSFSSPYYAGRPWGGVSKRTWERAGHRPVVKLYFDAKQSGRLGLRSPLLHEARSAYEHGRIEFKTFDAMPSAALLAACAQLLVGVCLDDELPLRSETVDVSPYRQAALHGFADDGVRAGAASVLERAERALTRLGRCDEALLLQPLWEMLDARRTPAEELLVQTPRRTRLYWQGGLAHARG